MPNKIGIFIDVNTIGWTLIEQSSKEIIAMGSHVFSPGCENFGMGRREISKKFNKRLFRLRRARYARIRVRKIYLLKILIKNNMCPLNLSDLKQWANKKTLPENNFQQWINLDPYELRAKSVHEKISLHELGRILYQISIHRGYRFGERNSKLVESVLKEGSVEDGKVGFAEMRKLTRDETLGEYLNSIKPIQGSSYRRTKNNRERYVRILGERKENITPMNILKYELWEEVKGCCPYTGAEIPLDQLWTDEISVAYINPWSSSLNDSFFNKTLSFSSFQEILKERNPYDYFNQEDPDSWEFVKKEQLNYIQTLQIIQQVMGSLKDL